MSLLKYNKCFLLVCLVEKVIKKKENIFFWLTGKKWERRWIIIKWQNISKQ